MEYQSKFMKEAIDLASENIDQGGGPFGAIIVQDGKVVGKGCNSVTNHMDPTAHAEVMAIRDACKNLNTFVLEGCEIYSSCEPCPMCLSAIYWAHIDKLYYGTTKDDAAKAGFDDSFIYQELSLAKDQRRVQAIEKERNLSQAIFNKWIGKEDRVKY